MLPAWRKHLNLPPGPGLKAALAIFDNLYLRPQLPNGKRQVIGKLGFTDGPGYKDHWKGYDMFGTATLARAHHEYGRAHYVPPAGWGTLPAPTPEPEPPIIVQPPVPTPDLERSDVWLSFFNSFMTASGRDSGPMRAAIKRAAEML